MKNLVLLPKMESEEITPKPKLLSSVILFNTAFYLIIITVYTVTTLTYSVICSQKKFLLFKKYSEYC